MKPLAIVGLVLALIGGYVVVRGLNYTTRKDVVELGPLKASVKEERAIPTWVGGVLIAGGILLIATGMRRKA
jgi:hypothetical protein